MPDRQLSRRLWLGGSAALLATHWAEILAAQAHAHEAMRSASPAMLSTLDAKDDVGNFAKFNPPTGEAVE